MFAHVARFEASYQLRRVITLVSFIIMMAAGYLAITVAGSMSVAVKGLVPATSPLAIASISIGLTALAMFVLIATATDPAMRDFRTGMDVLIRPKPVARTSYVLARFAGAFLTVCLICAGAALGILIGSRWSWAPGAIGAIPLENIVPAVVYFALPNLFLMTALFFTIAMLARNLIAAYLGAIGLVILYFIVHVNLERAGYGDASTLLDPFGFRALVQAVQTWAFPEFGTRQIAFEGMLLWNRALWLGISAALLALAIALSSPRERARRSARAAAMSVTPMAAITTGLTVVPGGAGRMAQLMACVRSEARAILRSWTFLVLIGLGFIGCVGSLLALYFGTGKAPVSTDAALEVVVNVMGFVCAVVAIIYGAEAVWRERQTKFAAIVDATPTDSSVFIVAKALGFAFVVLSLLVLAMATGVLFQLATGMREIAFGSYLNKLFLDAGSMAFVLGIVSMLVQAVVNKKHFGLILVFLGVVAVFFAPYLKIDWLVRSLSGPSIATFDADVLRTAWFVAYWACAIALMGLLTHVLWIRGLAGNVLMRLARARTALTPAVAVLLVVTMAGVGATAGYLYANPSAAAWQPVEFD